MSEIKISLGNARDYISDNEIALFESEVALHRSNIYKKTGRGHDFLGWVELPSNIDAELLDKIEKDARKMQQQSEVVVVCGIGGSYLGARAVIDALSNPFRGLQDKEARKSPLMLYAGHQLDEDYMAQLLELLDEKDYSVIVISKSGTTTEPAVAFRLLKAHLEQKYGEAQAGERIFAVTDADRGALKKLATEKSYATYVIPDDVGGRFSVLTPVGLLPIAVAGIDIRQLVDGAREMQKLLKEKDKITENPAALYAVARNILYRKGKTTEILAGYTPSLNYLVEWWKQLYGESEGKEQKGIFPAGVNFTTDLHSMGQYIQDGLRNLFETVLTIESPARTLEIPADPQDLDGLNFLAGKRLGEVNRMASLGTMMAHVDGDVPNLEITLARLDALNLGSLIYFFEMACAISGYILEVNPFDQPGVEAYKKNMFALLEKPGYEKETEAIKKRLKEELS
ncbi:MAG: glucose-6-phosphate isomerase [Bacteroides sp.]|jgi:glucose-6-phosphate isomerase|nr:glucose-6-phosphate isomerase [Bacteroides sp.]